MNLPQANDEIRSDILGAVESDGKMLGNVIPQFRADPDIVLAAISEFPAAWRYCAPELATNTNFIIEAVQKNPKLLQLLSAENRNNRAIVLAAINRDPSVLPFASRQLRKCFSEIEAVAADARVAKLLPYEGENLRLVGYCNKWRTTDSKLRFRKAEAYKGLLPQSVCLEPSRPDATRHCLLTHLPKGVLSFQVISCTRQYNFRIYPVDVRRRVPLQAPKQSDHWDGMFQLAAGDPSAVISAAGGEKDGHSCNFYINEATGVTVTIFVEVMNGYAADWKLLGKRGGAAGTSHGVAVWYEVVPGLSPHFSCMSLVQSRRKQQPKDVLVLPRSEANPYYACMDEVRIVEDADSQEHCQEYVSQAIKISDNTFIKHHGHKDLASGWHMTLLVDDTRDITLGFCIYIVSAKENNMWVNHLAVTENLRCRGYGKALVSWAVIKAQRSECTSIRLNSLPGASKFYEPLGFRFLEEGNLDGLLPMELKLPQWR